MTLQEANKIADAYGCVVAITGDPHRYALRVQPDGNAAKYWEPSAFARLTESGLRKLCEQYRME